MKAILRLIGSLLIGAFIGFFIMVPLLSILDGESPIAAVRQMFSKGFMPKLAEIGWMLIAVLIAFILHIIIHEGGHLVAGLLTGYRFVSFRFLNWTLISKDGHLQWRNFEMVGTGGQCLLAPPDKPVEQIDTRWYNAGGVLANLIIVAIALVLLWAFDLPGWLSTLLVMMVVIGLLIAAMNGIPMKMGGVANDGLNLLQLEKDLPAKKCFANILDINARNQAGERYEEMPDHLFEMPEPFDWKNSMHTASALAAASKMLSMHLWEDAYQLLTQACANKADMMQLYQMEVESMMTQACIATGRDEEARQHYDEQVKKYVTQHASTQSDKQLTTMAVALALDNDRAAAEEIYNKLKENREKYIHQGDVAMSLDIMRWLLENRQ